MDEQRLDRRKEDPILIRIEEKLDGMDTALWGEKVSNGNRGLFERVRNLEASKKVQISIGITIMVLMIGNIVKDLF